MVSSLQLLWEAMTVRESYSQCTDRWFTSFAYFAPSWKRSLRVGESKSRGKQIPRIATQLIFAVMSSMIHPLFLVMTSYPPILLHYLSQ